MREGRPKGSRTRWSCPTGGDKDSKIKSRAACRRRVVFSPAGTGVTGGSSASGSLFFFCLAQRRKWKSEHEVSSPFSLPLPFPLFSDHPCLSPLPLFFLLVSASSRLALDAPETERTFVIVGLQAHIKLKGGRVFGKEGGK